MNLTRALEVALPEIPARQIAQTCPRLHPDVASLQGTHCGWEANRACVFVPGVQAMFNLAPQTWELVRFFDGQPQLRTSGGGIQQVSAGPFLLDEVHQVADDFESIEFWYKTPREKNIALMQLSADERRNALKRKNKWGDLALI